MYTVFVQFQWRGSFGIYIPLSTVNTEHRSVSPPRPTAGYLSLIARSPRFSGTARYSMVQMVLFTVLSRYFSRYNNGTLTVLSIGLHGTETVLSRYWDGTKTVLKRYLVVPLTRNHCFYYPFVRPLLPVEPVLSAIFAGTVNQRTAGKILKVRQDPGSLFLSIL